MTSGSMRDAIEPGALMPAATDSPTGSGRPGFGELRPRDSGATPIKRADTALYKAKNRVEA